MFVQHCSIIKFQKLNTICSYILSSSFSSSASISASLISSNVWEPMTISPSIRDWELKAREGREMPNILWFQPSQKQLTGFFCRNPMNSWRKPGDSRRCQFMNFMFFLSISITFFIDSMNNMNVYMPIWLFMDSMNNLNPSYTKMILHGSHEQSEPFICKLFIFFWTILI